MAYDFFFSYRRADYGPIMREFFTDLGEDVRKLRGLNKEESPAFFDQEEIETGDQWDLRLLGALQQSKVLVPLYSPAYFKSEYCGREWNLFHLRRQRWGQMNPGPNLPAVIRPVVWIPIKKSGKLCLPDSLAQPVKDVQYTWLEEDSPVNQAGLEQLVRQKAAYNKLYWDFVRGFAEGIVQAMDQYDLPPLDHVPALADVPPLFNVSTAPAGPAPGQPRPSFRRHVRFIFAALQPQHLGAGRAPDPYLDTGGSDWKPFYPDLRQRIGTLAQFIASDPALDFESDRIELSNDLAQQIRDALDEGRIVVVLVDRWSLYASPVYQDIFRGFDQENFANCAVLLPWNPGDQELVDNKAQIDQVIGDVLHFHNSQFAPTSPYYCRDVGSVDELRQTLGTVLGQIQAEMRRAATPRRPVTPGFGRPTVAGPGG